MNSDDTTRKIDLILESRDRGLIFFYPLLQDGFGVRVQVGQSTQEVLCRQLGVKPDYLDDRIKTIFLDGKPIDEASTAFVKDGATLALSGALPGLVGATMRRGGYYAVLRGQITYGPDQGVAPSKPGLIRVKLFNMLIKELGPVFLERGLYFNPGEWERFQTGLPEGFEEICRSVRLDGRDASPSSLKASGWPAGTASIELRAGFGD